MNNTSMTSRIVAGAAAGLAATAALQPVRRTTAKRFPRTKPPMRQPPGEFMVERMERLLPERTAVRIPEQVDKAAATALSLGYGITFGALYGAIRKRPGNVLADGAALGVVCWAAGYLGWLPATGLMPPVTRQRPAQVVVPILEHLFYGVVAVAALKSLSD